MKKLIALLAIILASLQVLYAQKSYVKFGKISQEEIELQSVPLDTSASAVVLADIGRVNWEVNSSEGLRFVFKRHLRIKILNKEGYDYANHEIPYYAPQSGTDEKVSAIKGVTYNLNDGNIEKSKLTKDGIFIERTSKYWKKRKVTMPDVKEGSIIEITYSVSSAYWYNIREWAFQMDIPVLWSEYKLEIPEYFTYQPRMQGYVQLQTSDNSKYKATPDLGNTRIYQYIAKDVPAFRVEPFMTSKHDYVSKVAFELSGIRWPGRPYKSYSATWTEVGKNFLESDQFGGAVKTSAFAKKLAEELVDESQSATEKVETIVTHLKDQIQWSGSYSRYRSQSFKKTYEEKKGGCADINLLLVATLRKAGIEADPVLLSTRNHGFIRKPFPSSDQFNYVICRAKIDDKYVLFDATDPYIPNYLLPIRCLNGEGWVVSEASPGWITLDTKKKNAKKISGAFVIGEDGELTGDVKSIYQDYGARSLRYQIINDGEEKYSNELLEKSKWELDEINVTDADNSAKPLTISYYLEGDEDIESAGTKLYFSPIFFLKQSENPFKAEERIYPIDYSSPQERTYYATIELPLGYEIEEKPSNANIALPDKGGIFTYSITQNGNKLTVLSQLKINKSMFIQTEYPYLKEFYSQMVNKHAEQIVLKKS